MLQTDFGCLEPSRFLFGHDSFGFESLEHWPINILNERQDHSFTLDFAIQNHFRGDGGRITHSSGHGRIATVGLTIAD